MSAALSPSKVVLLAAQFTATGDIASLASLAAGHGDALRKKLVLRLLLTYLPSHLTTEEYLPLLQSLESADYSCFFPLQEIDTSSVQSLSDEQAAKKVRKLRLQPLSLPGAASSLASSSEARGETEEAEEPEDPLAVFLIQRAYAVDDGSGALPELPALLAPFLSRSYFLRTWTISVLLPLLRRNCEYYPDAPLQQTLANFEHLPDRLAVARLLSNTGSHEDTLHFVGRDLRGLIGPWLYSDRRWTKRRRGSESSSSGAVSSAETGGEDKGKSASEANGLQSSLCPGWEEVLQWLTAHAAKSWRVAARAIEQWDGPSDADLGGFGTMWLDDREQEYLEYRYARAALACVYLLPESSEEAMAAAHAIVGKIIGLLDQDPLPALPTDLSLLSPVSTDTDVGTLLTPKNAVYLRNDLLSEANVLTKPSRTATKLLHALVLSASLLNKMGASCTIRRAGELAVLQNEREQKTEAANAIHWVATNGTRNDDRYWIKARNEILWLRDWGADDEGGGTDDHAQSTGSGVFGQVKREFIEVEFLKALLTNTRYFLARSLYEDSPDHPLSNDLVQDTVLAAALNAYDNASNPNRTRGGLKKCDEIIHTFPLTVEKSLPATRRAEALMAATHGLCDYRLVLKQGEPFTPVVLRVHTDPLSILGKVLEQNPRSYTNIQALLKIASDIVDAGLTVRDKAGQPALTPEQAPLQRALAERRVTAMCIDAALTEDDFETAYSYVMSRLANDDELPKAQGVNASSSYGGAPSADTWSWRAALEAGKYRRTERTVRPTHLGTASANLQIRHLEQRIECLATALRVAPPDTLQEILNAYRRCEEELEAAVKAEDEQETAWDDAADQSWQHEATAADTDAKRRRQLQHNRHSSGMPGGFGADDGSGRSSPSLSSGRSNRPLASRVAAAASAAATSTYGGQASTRSGPRTTGPGHGSGGLARPPRRQQSASSAATAGAASDDAPLSLFDLSRATARVASRNFSALSSLRQTRELVGLSGGDGGGTNSDGHDMSGADGPSGPHVRKRDQLRDAAMGTLTSGVGWLIGAQPVNREQPSERN
ncbi:protein transport protein [Sporothrix schenckii 1099-18]|uniref:Sec39 domain-containing protein n=2 Tax=Sporothrix schenckii TaxID=29908 RepID=U7PW94_SPOS1|nr:protein transport protein [Sporothrix schenckii 1099-18]ERS99211.1 hypothetical protein HMPREF1624_04409 [Sporothrix schenckii ATCC 58251]KJR83109.1 protein transport protein [Sporothrix schenckii 1099-18]